MTCDLLLAACLTIFGPGVIATADPGVLERVAERRLNAGWGLSSIEGYTLLTATADCSNLGRSGWLIAGGKVLETIVVDCAQLRHRQPMIDNGLLVDANRLGLNHEMAWLVLR